MNSAVIIAVVVVILALASVAVLTNVPTGMVVSPSDSAAASQTPLPRHIFYNTPRVFANESYSATCYPSGEVMNILPDSTNKCCEGLDELPIIDEAQEGCVFITGGALCSDCGNGRCEYGENNCNCPEDCNLPPQII